VKCRNLKAQNEKCSVISQPLGLSSFILSFILSTCYFITEITQYFRVKRCNTKQQHLPGVLADFALLATRAVTDTLLAFWVTSSSATPLLWVSSIRCSNSSMTTWHQIQCSNPKLMSTLPTFFAAATGMIYQNPT